MNPVLPKQFDFGRQEGMWNRPELPMRKGRRRFDRPSLDHPPSKFPRVHPNAGNDLVHEPVYGRPPSLLDSSFPTNNFPNLNRRRPSPALRRDRSYESPDQFSLERESWRMANEPLPPMRRGETSGAWIKPGGRLSSETIDAAPKTVNQRAIPIASTPPSKPIRGSSPVENLVLTSDVIPPRAKSRDNYDDDDQAKLTRIRNDLERMKQEDKEGYELLLKALASANDSNGSAKATAERNALIAEDNYSTKQSLVCRPDYEMNVEGGRKFQEKSDYLKPPRSPSAPNSNAVRPSLAVKDSDKKIQSLLDTPAPPPTQPRWESWRNLSSDKRDASIRSPYQGYSAPPADSWRTSTVSSMASSWRSTSKVNL
ncbi:hypothetical protein KIN20_011076 [Parelaphostrongylus tenuis]|uniref:Uncharacterized protein n=1 Tax=Parelaphostrongylus tenuis TaxID=148309 RepID=A0AAD5MDG9_PARTN|nr:hypothetical protein KIN20_011076 [Parelaphostrongylus tenuis]